MVKKVSKRLLALLLSVLMIVSAAPLSAFAAENNQSNAETEAFDANSQVWSVLLEMNNVLLRYLGTTTMSEEEILDVVVNMDWDTMEAALADIEALKSLIMELPEQDAEALADTDAAETLGILESTLVKATTLVAHAAKTNTVLDGQVTVTDSSGTGSVSGDVVTITAKGSLFSKATNTVTITNASDSQATLKFDYTATTYNSFTIDGAAGSSSGTHSVLLAAGASTTFVIKSNSGFSNLTATLKLSNFSLTKAAASSNVTFNYDSSLGSITVGGTAVASGTQQEVTLTDGAALTATVATGSKFLAWINEATNEVLSRDVAFTLMPTEDMTVKAVFIGANAAPHFWLGSTTRSSESLGLLGFGGTRYYYNVSTVTHLFDDLNKAATAAANSASKTLVLVNDSTLPAGNYTIPSGVTLLIPFDDANTMYTTAGVSTSSYATPSAYRTLTMADGAKLTVNGAVSLSAKHRYANGAQANGGSPTGKVSFIKMNSGSNITVNKGGSLYAYGYITGSGTVTAESGATVYEYFQIMDFRGGDQSTQMDNGVFPISAYYVQNIEVPMTLKSGATEYSYITVYMQGASWGASVAFISNNNAMFNLTSGEITKSYDGSTDRLKVEANGDMLMSPIDMNLGMSSLNSEDYVLPINSNITVDVKSGSMTLTQDMAMLPGSEIIIREGVTCKLNNGVNVYVYDKDNWGGYTGTYNRTFIPISYAPSKTYTRTDADLVDAKVQMDGYMDASLGYIYTTAGGANIFSTGTGKINMLAGTATHTYQITQAGDVANSVYTEIPVVPAMLKNADGTYVSTTTSTYQYIADKGLWCDHSNVITQPAVDASCTETGLTEGSYCGTCGEVYATQEVVAAKGHIVVIDAAVEATCTSTGLTEGSHCSVCGTVIVAQELIPVKAHTVVTDAAKEATCTETGLTEGSHCSVCDTVIVAQQVVPMKGHTPGVGATCTDAQKCTVCGESLAAALGHNYVETVIAPTCTEGGYTVHTCSRCGDSYRDSETAAKGHSLGEGASCTEAGTCTACGTVLEAALGHEYNSVVTKATCTTGGYTTHTCSRCGDSYKDSIVEAFGHTVVTDAAKKATCTETGLTEGSHCSVCDTVLVAQTVIPANGHTVVIDAGKNATCTEDGLTEGKHCSVCDEVLVAQEVIPAKGHTIVFDVAKAATCTEDGLTEGKHCAACGEVLVAQKTIPATGHDMKDATCTMPIHCANGCGYTEGAALGHKIVIDEEYPAFCTEPGLTAGSHCTVCNEAIVPQEVIPPLGHNLVYYDAKKPTYTGVGWEAYEDCTRCAHTTYVEIPKLETPTIKDYNTFLENLALLEELAYNYSQEVPGTDPLELVIKYIRTGVDRYNSGSWGIMAGYENAGFAAYVAKIEDEFNSFDELEFMIAVSSLKNIANFVIPNGNKVDFGHMFGTMDITYHNDFGVNHADVAGWAGDVVDLMSAADQFGVKATDIEGMVAEIAEKYLLVGTFEESTSTFASEDMYGDLDGFYIMNTLKSMTYEQGTLTSVISEYFTEDLTDAMRADYFIRNRMNGISLRETLRNEVYNEYIANKVITTLESTREFESDNLNDLRKACCYAFADYICELAGDYVEVTDNPYYSVFSSTTSVLAPGITQDIKYATSADDKQMVYYIATADITRDDVNVYANYHNNDPAGGWAMQRVLDQANAAQAKYGDPNSENYIENYNVIASINGSGYNMATGEPSGLLVMNGVEYHSINSSGYFAILKDGTAMIGSQADYQTYKSEIAEGVAGFGTTLIKNGKIAVTATSNYYTSRASRTAVGITATGKVVFMVLDGRQEPFSCGGSMEEIAQIMFEAGCVEAVNLDGGGSTTFVAKQEGAEALEVVNSPSDGAPRSVSTSLMMVSTAASSTAFDHANLDSEYDYLTVGSSMQITASGVSATGNAAEIPEGTTWAVADEKVATITEDGVLTALRNGTVEISLMLGDDVIGTKSVYVVTPDNIYFAKESLNAVYGEKVELPVKALYENKDVLIQSSDVVFTVSNSAVGSVDGFYFIGKEGSNVKKLTVTAALAANAEKTATINVALYNQGEISFDFDQATGGDRMLAWYREVSNSTTDDSSTYEVVNPDEDMVTSYVFAIDMTQIDIPEQLSDLTTMLPGADMEGASAWTFLCQLAERISVLSEIKPVIYFDKDVTVDYSNLTVVNEYFELKGTEFDEATNSLTLTLNWKDQTAAINPDSANPLCIVNGIKLTPKADADWGAKNRLEIATSGEISYKIYLRASALYSFSMKPENQEIYGLYPFTNPNDTSEQGGYFEDVYIDFADSYTLSKKAKEGWTIENGGFAYYVNGQKLTGVQKIDGQYYDFGENGVNIGQTKYSGLVYDEVGTRGVLFGEVVTGWRQFNDVYYYFDTDTTYALKDGRYLIDNFYYVFDENGVNTMGQWVRVLYQGEIQTKYINTGKYVVKRFAEINGKTYWFDKNGFLVTGDQVLKVGVGERPSIYLIDENGVVEGRLETSGSYTCADGIAYGVIDGRLVTAGIHEFDSGVYFCNNNYDGILSVGKTYIDGPYATEEYPEGWYYFDETGRMYDNEFANVDGNIYYFEKGKPAKTGVFEIDGETYYAIWNGTIQTGKVYITVSGGADALSGAGYYYFDENGRLYDDEFANVNGTIYYMEGGQPGTVAGLKEVDGKVYFIQKNGVCRTGKVNVTEEYTNGILAAGTYYFNADGALASDEFITMDGKQYYILNGQLHGVGVFAVGDDLYCAEWNNVIRSGKIYITAASGNGIVNAGWYYTDETGRFYNHETRIIDGTVYYMVNGKPETINGVRNMNGNLYCFNWNGAVRIGKIYVTAESGNGVVAEGWYYTDETGRFYNDEFVTIDGYVYFMKDGQPEKVNGVRELHGGLYCFEWNGRLRTGKIFVTESSSNGIVSEAWYYTDENGRFYHKEFLEIDGATYYMEQGTPYAVSGMIEVDGRLYCLEWNGKVRTGKIYVTADSGKGILAPGWYYTNETGALTHNEFLTIDGNLYFMQNGTIAKLGVFEFEGKLYFADKWNGKIAHSGRHYITVHGSNEEIIWGYHDFDENGVMLT